MVHEMLREHRSPQEGLEHGNVFFGKSDRIPGCESMLIDTGAFNNIAGDGWVERMDKVNKAHGIPQHEVHELEEKVILGGVGTGTQESTQGVTVPVEVGGIRTSFQATVLKDSNIPAILGMKTMQKNHGILDLRNKCLIFPDKPEDVQIIVSKNTKVYHLEQAPGGYFMLPCTPGSDKINTPHGYQIRNQHADAIGK